MQGQTNRRVPTRHTGVYFKETKHGRSYSISFKAEGRLVWKTIPGGERDAVTARASVMSKLGQGEKVAPSRETFLPFAESWLDSQRDTLGERTIDQYDRAIRLHLGPAFGRLPLHKIDEDGIARLIADMTRRGYAAWTIRGTLIPLGRILNQAVRRGRIPQNPVKRLERGERPSPRRGDQRILNGAEIAKLLDHATTPAYRTLLAAGISTGLRQSELLGLQYADLDLAGGVVRVRAQLSRKTQQRKRLKTGAATRDVILPDSLAAALREHRLASPHSRDDDFIFCTKAGRPLGWSNVDRRCLHKAANDAVIPHVPFHALRHTFVSLLVAQGADLIFVSGQLGHSDPTITLRTYGHLWEQHKHAAKHRTLLDAALSPAISANRGLTTDAADGSTTSTETTEPSQISSGRK